jgi:hypothetical protein
VGSNPTPGTHRIHTPFGRLILGLREDEPKLQALLLGEPRHRADRSPEDLPLVLWIAMSQQRPEIAGVLPQPPDRREGPGSLARTLCASKLVPDLSLIPLEVVHDLLDQDRVDPGGDAAQLRMLIRLDVGQTRLEPCPSPEGLFATTPQEGLLVALQSRQAVRTQELPIQDSNYLGLEAIVPEASLALGHSLLVPLSA